MATQQLRFSGPLRITAAKEGRKPRVTIEAYSGDILRMRVGTFDAHIVDLAGMQLPSVVPLLDGHENEIDRVVGSGVPRIKDGRLFVEGTLSAATESGKRILELAADGIEFQASLGAEGFKIREAYAGDVLEINGRTVEVANTVLVYETSLLREVSIVPLGVDNTTTVSIAASHKGDNMPDDIQTYRQNIAAEDRRIADLRAVPINERDQLNASYLRESGIEGVATPLQLRSYAIAEGHDRNWLELELHRARRADLPTSFSSHMQTAVSNEQVLECALAKHLHQDISSHYGEQICESASNLGVTHFLDLVKLALQASGNYRSSYNKTQLLQAVFSTTNFSTLLSNVQNKSVMQAYRAYPSVARIIAQRLNANDFKTQTGVQLVTDGKFANVDADKEFESTNITDRSYTFSVNTYGRLYGVNRRDLVNDDVGLFETLPQIIGRGAATSLEKDFWTLVLSNPNSFYHADNANFISGAGSDLDATSLGALAQKLWEMEDEQGDPIGVQPKWLICPPSLKVTADALYNSSEVNVGASSASTENRIPSGNPFYQLYKPLVTAWIGAAAGLSGASDTAFYLMGDSSVLASWGIAYLDDNQAPVIEQADANFNQLGVQFRGYMDWGVCAISPKGSAKSAGA